MAIFFVPHNLLYLHLITTFWPELGIMRRYAGKKKDSEDIQLMETNLQLIVNQKVMSLK